MSSRATLRRDVKKDFGRLAASPKMNSAEDHWACLCWVRADRDPAVPEQQTNPLKWINQKHRSFLLGSPTLDPLSFSQSQTLYHFFSFYSGSLLPCLWLLHGWAFFECRGMLLGFKDYTTALPLWTNTIPNTISPQRLYGLLFICKHWRVFQGPKETAHQIQSNHTRKYKFEQIQLEPISLSMHTQAHVCVGTDTNTQVYHIRGIRCHQNHRKKLHNLKCLKRAMK